MQLWTLNQWRGLDLRWKIPPLLLVHSRMCSHYKEFSANKFRIFEWDEINLLISASSNKHVDIEIWGLLIFSWNLGWEWHGILWNFLVEKNHILILTLRIIFFQGTLPIIKYNFFSFWKLVVAGKIKGSILGVNMVDLKG